MSQPERVSDFERHTTPGGLVVFTHSTSRFKTRLMRLHLQAPLGPGACARSLVPNLLRWGTRTHPSMLLASRALEELYGASFGASTHKLGGSQILSFRLDVVDEKFLPGRPAVFAPALELARELILDPHLPEGRFPDHAMERERDNLVHEIEAIFNDKSTYAFQRFLEQLFAGDPYGAPLYGTMEQAQALSGADALDAWKEVVACPATLYFVGDVRAEEVCDWAQRNLPFHSEPMQNQATWRETPPAAPWIVEEQPISQSKLLVGHDVDLRGLTATQFDALRVLGSVLGGGFHSRLFRVIREQHSLAYSASASVDRLKGVLYASCGIDAAERLRVAELIDEQIESLRLAPPSAEEMGQACALLAQSQRVLLDSPGGMVDALEAGIACGFPRPVAELSRALEKVTAEAVHEAAQRIQPTRLLYCLAGDARHAAP